MFAVNSHCTFSSIKKKKISCNNWKIIKQKRRFNSKRATNLLLGISKSSFVMVLDLKQHCDFGCPQETDFHTW